MKYYALIRTAYSGGKWISGSGTHVYKSEALDCKEEAKKWTEEKIKEMEKSGDIGDEYRLLNQTVIALDENESENFEEFLKYTFD